MFPFQLMFKYRYSFMILKILLNLTMTIKPARYYLTSLVLLCLLNTAHALPSRIVGGVAATDGTYPWIVALIEAGDTALVGQYCGASLIAPTWVLTAAHCVTQDYTTTSLSASSIQVIVNFTSLRAAPAALDVKRIIVHPEYEVKLLQNDLALLELATASNAPPVALFSALQGSVAVGTMATVLGWGTTDNFGNFADVLQVVSLPVVDNASCEADLVANGVVQRGEIFDSMICADGALTRRDSCVGDSGGPLVIQDEQTGEVLQIGTVSFGAHLCGTTSGVYSRVSAFEDFISQYVPEAKFQTLSTATECDPVNSAVPVAPSLSITVDQNEGELKWNKVANAEGYKVLYLPFNSPDLSSLGSVDMLQQTRLSGYLSGTRPYYIAVQAYNCAGESAFSNIGLMWF